MTTHSVIMSTHTHSLIKTGDPDTFSQIQDGNGEVVLRYCRICKKGEGELRPSCSGPGMSPEVYRDAALRTENTPPFITHARRGLDVDSTNGEQWVRAVRHDQRLSRMLHAILGMVTELGELCDPLKRHLIYGTELNTKLMFEERGDQAWYDNLFDDALGSTIYEIWDRNIAKLRARFPDKFTEERAVVRDLDAEKRALEGKPYLIAGVDMPSSATHHGALPLGTKIPNPQALPPAHPLEFLPLPAGRALEQIYKTLNDGFAPTPKHPEAITAAVGRLVKEYAQRGFLMGQLEEERETSRQRLDTINMLRAKIKAFSDANT